MTATLTMKWTCTPSGQWVRRLFIRDGNSDRPASTDINQKVTK